MVLTPAALALAAFVPAAAAAGVQDRGAFPQPASGCSDPVAAPCWSDGSCLADFAVYEEGRTSAALDGPACFAGWLDHAARRGSGRAAVQTPDTPATQRSGTP